MKLTCSLLAILFFVPLACKSNSTSKKSSSVSITIENDNACNGAKVIKACRTLAASGIDPSKIWIKDERGKPSIRFSSDSNMDYGPLQKLFGSDKYDGQIILLRREDQKILFSGSSKTHYWFVVDESVTINSIIDAISDKQTIEYVICDADFIRKNIHNLTVPIDLH
jgi:hypothetical protein